MSSGLCTFIKFLYTYHFENRVLRVLMYEFLNRQQQRPKLPHKLAICIRKAPNFRCGSSPTREFQSSNTRLHWSLPCGSPHRFRGQRARTSQNPEINQRNPWHSKGVPRFQDGEKSGIHFQCIHCCVQWETGRFPWWEWLEWCGLYQVIEAPWSFLYDFQDFDWKGCPGICWETWVGSCHCGSYLH